jgi:hypothetical protein
MDAPLRGALDLAGPAIRRQRSDQQIGLGLVDHSVHVDESRAALLGGEALCTLDISAAAGDQLHLLGERADSSRVA